jgi:hypothetical protein
MDPSRKLQEWIETASASIVEVDVDAPVKGKNEVADGVGPLDVMRVAFEGLEEPRIFFLDESKAVFIRPELVLIEKRRDTAEGDGEENDSRHEEDKVAATHGEC